MDNHMEKEKMLLSEIRTDVEIIEELLNDDELTDLVKITEIKDIIGGTFDSLSQLDIPEYWEVHGR